jgi:hypothetical protein
MIGSRDGSSHRRLQRFAKASTIDDVAELPKSGAEISDATRCEQQKSNFEKWR